MKMTVEEAVDYILKADGMPFTEELLGKVRNFIRKLPRNPQNDSINKFEIADYSERIYYKIWIDYNPYYMGDDGEVKVSEGGKIFHINMYESGVIPPNPEIFKHRVKSNEEALEVLKEIESIKFAYDIDKYWNMSDDHSYWSKMSDMDDEAHRMKTRLLSKLMY